MNKIRSYNKCEECRDLQKKYNTNDLVNGNFVYHDNRRYKIGAGFVTEMCSYYNRDNDTNCVIHSEKTLITCQGTKCNNMFEYESYNFCKRCRERGDKSKNKFRNDLREFKIKLGGNV
jgi:hypothetical protein